MLTRGLTFSGLHLEGWDVLYVIQFCYIAYELCFVE